MAAARRRTTARTAAKHRAPRPRLASPFSRTAPGRRRRRAAMSSRIGAWLGFARQSQREREMFQAEVRELRLANATLRAQVAVFRLELEHASTLAETRAAQQERLTLLLPMLRAAFAASAARERIHLDYSPNVKQLVTSVNVIDLTDNAVVNGALSKRAAAIGSRPNGATAEDTRAQIVLPVRPAAVDAPRRSA